MVFIRDVEEIQPVFLIKLNAAPQVMIYQKTDSYKSQKLRFLYVNHLCEQRDTSRGRTPEPSLQNGLSSEVYEQYDG